MQEQKPAYDSNTLFGKQLQGLFIFLPKLLMCYCPRSKRPFSVKWKLILNFIKIPHLVEFSASIEDDEDEPLHFLNKVSEEM